MVFLAYVTQRAHTLFDFRLYLPKQWCGDTARRGRAQVPHDVAFATKTEQGTGMITEAVAAKVPFSFAAGDEVYGRSSKLRAACEDAGKGYVFAVPVNFTVTTPAGRKATAAALARLISKTAWETRSCGAGCKGHRDYEWALAATSSPRHHVLIRRSISDPADQAFFYCHAPGLASLPTLVKVAGKRWPVEECFQQGKGQTGLDQHQLRLWHSFHRHTVLSMCALALLTVTAARPPRRPAPWRPGPQPARTSATAPLTSQALARHREAPRPPRRGTTARRWPDPHHRARSPPPVRPAHATCEPGKRDLPRRVEHLAATPPGTRPMAPLPDATPGRRLTSKINTDRLAPGKENPDCSTRAG